MSDTAGISETQNPEYNKKVQKILIKFAQRRKARYFFGALSLGIALVLFCAIWLIVAYRAFFNESIIWESDRMFVLLIGIFIFFVVGIYLLTTLPKLKTLPLMQMAPQSQTPLPPPQEKFMCPYCGFDNVPEEALFCPVCSRKFAMSSDLKMRA